MSRQYHIYWRPDMGMKDGLRFANVHLLQGYTQESVADYIRLADELRQTFPDARNEDIICSTVKESDRVKNFTIISYNHHIAEGEYPGYEQHESRPNNDQGFGAVPPYRW